MIDLSAFHNQGNPDSFHQKKLVLRMVALGGRARWLVQSGVVRAGRDE